MKHFPFLLRTKENLPEGCSGPPRSISYLVVLCMIALAFSGWFVLSSSAGDAPANGAVSADARSAVAAISQIAPPDPGSDIQTTTAFTHTFFLPLVLQGYYWRAPDSLAGVQLFADHREDELVLQIDQAGMRWARIPLFWFHNEPENTTPENYRWWYDFEEWLARLSARDVKVILTLTGNPSWAASYVGGPIDKVSIDELVEFMVAVVDRYSAPPYNVKHWEFYNEPDNGSAFYARLGWGYWGPWPEKYAEMLHAVYAPIKEADPDAQIVFGGLAYDNFTDTGGPFVREFLDQVLQHPYGKNFDIMNFHYYPVFHPRWDPYGRDIIGKATYLRDKLASYNVFKPFICTESGLWSDAVEGGGYEEQSRYVAQLFARSMEAELDATIWYKLIDDVGPGVKKHGVLEYDLTPKPAYYAYQTVTRQLAGAEYIGPLGPIATGSSEIEAYEFRKQGGLPRIIVAWTDDDLNHTLSLATTYVLVVDKYGGQTVIRDADDGVVDGQVQVRLGPSPVYLHLPADVGD